MPSLIETLNATVKFANDEEVMQLLKDASAKVPDGFHADVLNSDLSDMAKITVGRLVMVAAMATDGAKVNWS